MKIKFFSIVSGKDNKYWAIKDNFQKYLEKVGLTDLHELFITDTNSGSWEESGFLDTVYHKLDITRDYLKKGYYVFCSDLDIVFLKNPLPHLKNLMKSENYDIVFQHDYADVGEGRIYSVCCTGFYFVKPSQRTIQLFDTSIGFLKNNNKIDLENTEDRSDQNYINKKLTQKRFKSLRIQLLNKELFPNGWYWRQHYKNIDPYIVHYNCIKGIKNKENDMKKYHHWLV